MKLMNGSDGGGGGGGVGVGNDGTARVQSDFSMTIRRKFQIQQNLYTNRCNLIDENKKHPNNCIRIGWYEYCVGRSRRCVPITIHFTMTIAFELDSIKRG